MVAWPIGEVLDYYARRIEALNDKHYRDFWSAEALLVLNARDVLFDRWKELQPEEQERVLALDEALLQRCSVIARYAPVPNPNITDRRRWWWFLHEGPQVREQAATKER